MFIYRSTIIKNMQKKDLIYRYLLLFPETTQLEIAKTLQISLSTVNNAIQPLRGLGAVQVGPRKLRVIDKEKILLFWACVRKLHNDILYSTRVDLPVNQIEKLMPPQILFTAYSGFKFRYKDVPADYSEIYIYALENNLESIVSRFRENSKKSNLFVLSGDEHLFRISKSSIVPDEQLFVDLWNLHEWYAKEFVIKLKEKIL